MKLVKTLLAMSAAALILAGCAAEPAGEVRKSESEAAEKRGDDEARGKGLISGYKFTPLQVWEGVSDAKLFDADANTVFTFGVLRVDQKSAVLSLSPDTCLTDNYGIQLGPLGTGVRNNYGISLGVVNILGENHGLIIGALFNLSDHTRQLCGVNIAGKVQIAIANTMPGKRDFPNPFYFQLGAINYGDTPVQIGVLNWNPRSYIPLLPLVNFAMKKDGGE